MFVVQEKSSIVQSKAASERKRSVFIVNSFVEGKFELKIGVWIKSCKVRPEFSEFENFQNDSVHSVNSPYTPKIFSTFPST
jgi:hypothetical protein